LILKEAPRHKPKVETPPSSPKGVPDWTSKQQDEVCGSTREAEIPDFDPELTARLNKKTFKIPQQPKDEQPEEEEEFRPDWGGDEGPAQVGAEKGDVFTIKDKSVIDGKTKITVRKARFCVHCNAECAATLKTCPNCAGRPDGAADKATADLVGAVARAIRPTVSKWVDRGGRSAKGNMRDDYRRRWRRAKRLGYESVLDRFQRDEKDNFKFRINMLAHGWTEETIAMIDEVATSEGQPMPRAGQGRNYLQRQQSEGYYDRVDGHGCEADKPITERNVPAYVHERNAQRRAETALAAKQLPVPGKGSQGYTAAKGKGKGQKRPYDHAGSRETGDRTKGAPSAPSWTADATWWTATASTWWTANSTATEETKDDSSWLFPVLCIFLLGALFGGVVGYLIAYVRHTRARQLAPLGRIVVATDADWQAGAELRQSTSGVIIRQGDAVVMQAAIPQPIAPRNRMPQVRVPDQILVTRTGGSFHHVSGCSSTTRGEEAHANRRLDKCGLCYPAFREE
jgi:hypothetical protein